MRFATRWAPRSITTQIAILVVLAVFLGDLLSSGFVLLLQASPFSADRIANRIGLVAGLTVLALMIVSLFVALVAVYAIRSITAPLSFMAAATRAFGHSPASNEAALPERGPSEIAQVARALNEMRNRIRALLDDRTRMLAAISHDLRTPLTRLRLRAERVGDAEARDGMLRDVALIDELLGETLVYLREGVRSESLQRTDLPSLLQTICAEFSDVGHRVSYCGPQRLAFACRPRALARAVRNVVDNGVKHGSEVVVKLAAPSEREGLVHVDVSDNGPGIDAALRGAVFEPFFKADGARAPARGGFGLGLSIARDIVRDHGGSIELLDGAPNGLRVRIALPAAAATSLNDT
jgi:signal transduction histidine kinase